MEIVLYLMLAGVIAMVITGKLRLERRDMLPERPFSPPGTMVTKTGARYWVVSDDLEIPDLLWLKAQSLLWEEAEGTGVKTSWPAKLKAYEAEREIIPLLDAAAMSADERAARITAHAVKYCEEAGEHAYEHGSCECVICGQEPQGFAHLLEEPTYETVWR